MHFSASKTSLVLLMVAVLCACRMSCLAFSWQPSAEADSAHSCCQPSKTDQTEPAQSESNCKADVFESAIGSANLALPALHHVPDADLVEAAEHLDDSYNTPLHAPPDLLALHHILLI